MTSHHIYSSKYFVEQKGEDFFWRILGGKDFLFSKKRGEDFSQKKIRGTFSLQSLKKAIAEVKNKVCFLDNICLKKVFTSLFLPKKLF